MMTKHPYLKKMRETHLKKKPELNKNGGETRLDFQGTAWTNCWKNRWGGIFGLRFSHHKMKTHQEP